MKLKCISVLLLLVLVLSLFAGCSTKPAVQPNDVPNLPSQDELVPPTQDETNQPDGGDETPDEGDVPPVNPDTPEVDPLFYTVTLEHDSSKAAVSGLKDRYAEGETVSFAVKPDANHMVDKVICNSTSLLENNGSYSFVITADSAIRITYKVKPITVELSNDDSRGTVSGLKGEYQVGERVTFTVTPKAGWAVYSVRVNGEEQVLPYSFVIPSDGSRTIELAVSYEEDTLEARRKKVVSYAKHLTGDYYFYEGGVPVAEADTDNATHKNKFLGEDCIYRGIPYNEGLTSLAAYRTLPFEEVDGVYHIDPESFVQRWYWVFGASCADVPLWAWRTVDSNVDFAAAQYMTTAHGCIKVGEYEWTLKNGLLTDTYADVAKNGSAVMNTAYAQLQPGDACTRIKSGTSVGHTILITAVDRAKGTVTYCDTNGSARKANAMIDGMEVYRYGEYEKTVNYSWLQQQGYLPVTCAALRDESVTLPTLGLTDSAIAINLQKLTSGTLSSTQPISHVVVRFFDAQGKEVKQYIRYWKESSFKMSDFQSTRLLTGWDANSSYTQPQYQLYAKENTIDVNNLGLASGNYRCTVTVYNGGTSFDASGEVRSTAYVARDFEFTV